MTTTTVRAAYGDATFSAALEPKDITSIIKSIDKRAKRKKLSRADARQW
jgi:hypothetical protein